MTIKKCIVCGRYFGANAKQQICSEECKNMHKREYNSAYRKKPVVKEETKHKENNLVELAKAARDCGMTYGQYMAKKYAAKHPIIREW